jgi:hypothetical protein
MRNRLKQRGLEKPRIGSYMERPLATHMEKLIGKGTQKIPDTTAWTAIRNADKYFKKVRKMQKESTIASVALDAEFKDILEKAAKKDKTSLSKLFKTSILLYLNLNDDFKNAMQAMAKDMGLTYPFVIERLALSHLAEMAAAEELAGGHMPRALNEFTPGQTAREFYDSWKDNKVKQARNQFPISSDSTLSDAGKARLAEMQAKVKQK